MADLVAVGANDRYFSSTLALAAAKVLHAGIPRVTVAIMQNVVHQIGIYSRYGDGDCLHLYAAEKGDHDWYSMKNSTSRISLKL